MRARTAVGLAATVVALKAVLIGVVARGRCELIGRCGDGTAWYFGAGVVSLILMAMMVVTIADVRSFASRRKLAQNEHETGDFASAGEEKSTREHSA